MAGQRAIAELKDHLSAYLRAVERGAEVTVTDPDRPIARISSFRFAGSRVRFMPPTRDFVAIRDREGADAGWTVGSTHLLREERGDG